MRNTVVIALDEYGTVHAFASIAAAMRYYSQYKVKRQDKFGIYLYESVDDADKQQHYVKISTHVILR